MKIRILALLLCCLFIAALTGCNTVAGFGKDMQTGGEELQKAVKDN